MLLLLSPSPHAITLRDVQTLGLVPQRPGNICRYPSTGRTLLSVLDLKSCKVQRLLNQFWIVD